MAFGVYSSSGRFVLTMFGAAAVRNKKRKQQQQAAGGEAPTRGPYIKPFGPRFDPNELPYFKYKRALQEAKELQQNINKAKKARNKQKHHHKCSHHHHHHHHHDHDGDEHVQERKEGVGEEEEEPRLPVGGEVGPAQLEQQQPDGQHADQPGQHHHHQQHAGQPAQSRAALLTARKLKVQKRTPGFFFRI